LIQKKTGKTTGWIGYTLSWNWRQFDEINGGKRFPFRYDRRHDISIVCSHKFNEKITLSGSWIYGTGNAISVPTSTYSSNLNQLRTFDDVFLPTPQRFVIDGKNEFRMSAAHRLDASISFFKKKLKFERKWIISVYNVYSHINPYFAIVDEEFKTNPNTGLTEGKFLLKEIGFLPILPSVAYHVKF
jgi:hypothetical protein